MADPRPQSEEDVFAICYYNYAIVENRKSDEDLVYLLYHNILPDIVMTPKKFRMEKILPMLNYTKAYLSLEYIIQKFKPIVTYWHKFLNSDICKNLRRDYTRCCCCKGEGGGEDGGEDGDVCPDRLNIYNFLDIYTKHCAIRRYKPLLEIFSPHYNNPDLHSLSWQLHTGKLIKYCTLRYGDRMDPDVIALTNLLNVSNNFMLSSRCAWITGCLVVE